MPSLSVTRTYSSQARMARSRDSITLIPPNSTKGLSLAISMLPTLMIFWVISLCLLRVLRQGGADETAEQRVTVARRRGELGVELTGDEPRMIRRFHHFNQRAVAGAAGNLETGFDQLRQQVVVHFIAMTMALDDHILAVALMPWRPGWQLPVLGPRRMVPPRSEASVRCSVTP